MVMAMATTALLSCPTAGSSFPRPGSSACAISSGSKLISRVPAFLSRPEASRRNDVRAFINFQDDPIVKEALKEPVAFLGGVFAGLLRLDLNEDPLKEWVAKTSEAAGVKVDEETAPVEDGPEEIAIE